MVKKPPLAYMIGQSGLVASETTNVCCNVARASFSSWDTLGKTPPAPSSSDVLVESTKNEFFLLVSPPSSSSCSDLIAVDLKVPSPTSDLTTNPHSALLAAMLASVSILFEEEEEEGCRLEEELL
jgi:hypothetical protein